MDHFSISQISDFSGIKPHTIRMWEKRYDALNPDRSEGNTRYYDNDQLRRLLNIVSLMDLDYKVSELCSMADQKLFELVTETQGKTVNNREEYFISQLIAAGMDFNESHFEKLFAHCLLRYNIRDMYVKVIYPMLIRLGLMWSSNTLPPAYEHFISNIIRQKLLTAIDAIPPQEPSAERWMLFLPEDEFHEIGLLFANYIIRSSGKYVTYLGCNVPLQSISGAVKKTNPVNILLFLVHYDSPEDTQDYLNVMMKTFAEQNIFVSGNEKLISQLDISNNLNWLKSIEDLEQKV